MSADVPLKTRLNYSLISDTEKKICEIRALIMHLCLFFAWFNLVKPYDALKIEIADCGLRMVDGGQRWIAQHFDQTFLKV